LAPERSDLRKQMRTARARLSAHERVTAAAALANSLESLPEFLVDPRVAGYWAVAGEIPLHAVYASVRARAQTYCLPLINADHTLRFAAWRSGAALRNNRYGIPEPDAPPEELLRPNELDLVLVPLLGFDRRGNRLGSGAGYYDRAFAFLRGVARPAKPVLVGIGYHFQELAALAPESWDVKLDFVATDRELINCTEIRA
jgi:5-formyltetrahydrofolate cyclo-ligase